MRKIFKSFMLVAAAAMTFASCQREELNSPKETVSATLTMHAGVEQTKTYLDGNAVLWGKGEAVTLYVGAGETAKFVSSTATDAYDGAETASFEFTIEGVTASESYNLGGIYPASAATGINNNNNPKSFKIALPATQNAEPGKYDPSAYIMVLKPEVVTELPAEYTASFRRAVALNKITLTGVKEDISSVEITVPEKKYLAGRRYMDLTTGESGEIYDSGTQTNVVKVNGDFKSDSFDVWFCSWGVELAEGDELTIKMTAASKTYTRTIAARAEGIKFVEGDLNTLTVNMSSATEETLANNSGQYLVAAKKGDNWALMAPTASTYINSYETTIAATNTECSAFYEIANIENYVWTATTVDGGYTLSSCDGEFVSYPNNGENQANLAQSSVTLGLDIDDTQKATVVDMVSGRELKYNASSPRFAFYASGQTDIYFIPWVADTTPRIFVNENNKYEVEAAEGSIDIEYSTNDLVTSQINASVKSGASMTINSTSVADGKVTVNYAANTSQELKTATIVLSYDGAESKEVVITQAAAGVTKQYYVKVTTAPTDWSGTYLMVCDSKKMVLSSISTTSTKYGVGTTVTITDNKIEATETLASYQVVLSPGSTSGSYLMKFNGSYLYWSSGNSLATNASDNSNTNWLLSASNGNVTIKNCKDNDRVIGWNASSPRFACYTSSQTAIQLYKLEDGNAGGETPGEGGETTDPETPGEGGETTDPEEPEQGGSGEVVTETISGTFTSANSKLTLTTASGITIVQEKVSGSTAVNETYNKADALRVYKGHALKFSGKTITKIEFTHESRYKGNTVTASTGKYTSGDTSSVWEGESDNITITNTATGNNVQLRPTAIKVTYKK